MVSDVVSPVVEQDALQLEARVGEDWDDKGDSISRQRLHLDYGLNNDWAVRLVIREQYTDEEHFEHQATEGMVRWQLFESETAGFDGGFRLAYRLRDGDKQPNELVLSWALEKALGEDYQFRQNILIGWQMGQGREPGTDTELRWQLLRAVNRERTVWLGGELFNGFGTVGEGLGYDEQEHSAGLVARWQVTEQTRCQFGVLRGLSETAPDYAAKFFINYRF